MSGKYAIALISLYLCGAALCAGETRRPSPGNTTYYIHPANGNDAHSGLSKQQAWKTFEQVNKLVLSRGDRIEILAPGAFDQTLQITGSGSRWSPIEVYFAPGRYDFYPTNALRR